MTKDEALKLALEALEDLGMKHYESTGEVLYKETSTAIKEALANEALEKKAENARELGLNYEPEPVALEAVYETIIHWDEGGGKRSRRELARRIVSLYTTPPQRTWVGLTDREIDELWMSHHDDFGNPLSATGYERAIEAKLRSKND